MQAAAVHAQHRPCRQCRARCSAARAQSGHRTDRSVQAPCAAVSVRRKRKPSEFHSEVTRERIRAGVIIDRFQKHFMGEVELTPTQIRVGEILLRKVIPDLTHTDLSTTFTRRYVVELPAKLSDEEWEKKYSLPAPTLKSMQ